MQFNTRGFQRDIRQGAEQLDLIGWTVALDKFDNFPTSFAGDFGDLVEYIEARRAPKKHQLAISGLFGGDGRRCLENAAPRQFLPFDIDGADGDGVDEETYQWLVWYFENTYSHVRYETHSSQPDARKFRVIIELDKRVTDEQSRALGHHIQIESGFPDVFDAAVYRLSQLCYLAAPWVEVVRVDGLPVDVAHLLRVAQRLGRYVPSKAQVKRESPKLAASAIARLQEQLDVPDVVAFFQHNGLVQKESKRGLHVICPWVADHSHGDATGTMVFRPSADNGYIGGFHCCHSHCEHRNIKDVFRLIRGLK